MFKRFAIAILLLIALAACSTALQVLPTPTALPAATASATLDATRAPSALWIMDSVSNENRLLAVNPQTGEVLLQLPQFYGSQIVSSDGRWRYTADAAMRNQSWELSLMTTDLRRGAVTRIQSFTDSTVADYHDLSVQLALSRDNSLLALAFTRGLGSVWYTDVYFVDTQTGQFALPDVPVPITVFGDESEKPPLVQLVFSSDGQKLFVLRNRQRQLAEGKPPLWSTQIAIAHTDKRTVEHIEEPGEIQADGLWLNDVLSPDGRMLYVLQNIVRFSASAGYRFVALDTSRLEVTLSRLVDTTTGGQDFSIGAPGLRFTPDGQYLIGFAGRRDNAGNYDYFFQFLDTRSGEVTETPLQRTVSGANFDPIYALATPNGRLLYLIFVQTHEIIAYDLTQRAVVKKTVLQDSQSSFSRGFSWLTQLFIMPVAAKYYAQPSAILSPDGQRLYFVDVKDMNSGDGLWAVDVSTFKPLGHWLRGKRLAACCSTRTVANYMRSA